MSAGEVCIVPYMVILQAVEPVRLHLDLRVCRLDGT
jgi:hypothetical protein